MTRRAFIASLSCIAAAWLPGHASGQNHGRNYRLGILVQAPRNAACWAAFFDEMRKNGYIQDSNLSVTDGSDTRVGTADKIAKAIVTQRPDVIMTAGVLTTVVQKATEQYRCIGCAISSACNIWSPAVCQAGGLLSYGPVYDENFRRAAILVDKIFRGAKPNALSVEAPTRFELVINANSTKELGVTVPLSLLTCAEEVIE